MVMVEAKSVEGSTRYQASETAVKLDGISMSYRGKGGLSSTVLAGIDLEISPGEFVALIGPSGCGKSTLLKLIAALEIPTQGCVTICGEEPRELAEKHRLGVAFQDHALLPWLSIKENVELPFKLARRPVDNHRVGQLLELVGLAHHANSKPSQVSGGMKQRASIARSLMLNPSLLLLDEPFGALDAVTRKQLNIELQSIWTEQKITTVLVTHGVDEAIFLADRIIVLEANPGRVREVINVPFERPRSSNLMRTAEFHTLTDYLTELLEPAANVT
jgi:NitT/TauT family transport system ATP-binding protein